LLPLLKLSKFLPKTFIIRDVGVTINKKTIPKNIEEIKLLNIILTLNQILFIGVKDFEFSSPKIKKNIAIIKDQILIFPSLNNGNIATIKKNRKKTISKLLFVPILILLFFKS
tara:strand:- start:66 stop:404 length:339 start_codon:yes stop_codon:yes gene_type:complete